MGLVKKNPAADAATPAAKFEQVEDTVIENGDSAPVNDPNARVAAAVAAAAKAEAAKPAAAEEKAAAPAASTERAVAAAKPTALVSALVSQDPFKALENAVTVEWNTLPRIMAASGAFLNKETNEELGPEIVLEILSIQDHYVLSPGDDSDEAALRVRYSPDGITSQDGENMAQLLAELKVDYPKAKIQKRAILVGSLTHPGLLPKMKDDLIQIDLAPNSLKNFNQFRFTSAFKIGKGQLDAAYGTFARLTAIKKNENKRNWTEAGFASYAG